MCTCLPKDKPNLICTIHQKTKKSRFSDSLGGSAICWYCSYLREILKSQFSSSKNYLKMQRIAYFSTSQNLHQTREETWYYHYTIQPWIFEIFNLFFAFYHTYVNAILPWNVFPALTFLTEKGVKIEKIESLQTIDSYRLV